MKKITIIIVICLLMNITASYGFSNNLIEYVDIDLYRKIEGLSTDESINLYVWKEQYNIVDYRSELEKLGYNDKIYSNETEFQILTNVRNMSDMDILNERENYKISRLLALKNVIRKSQEEFINDLKISYSDIIYIGTYTNTLIGSFTKERIYKLIENESVISLSLYENINVINETNHTLNQTLAGYGTNSNPGLKNYLSGGYDGSGVKIGIIEGEESRFDPNSAQLQTAINNSKLTFVPVQGVNATIDNHGTAVTNIIIGEQFFSDGQYYEGIATGSSVYLSSTKYASHFFTAMTQFANLNVDIINFSGGFSTGSTYHGIDREVDLFLYNTKILFVKSAGNSGGDITSPGKAYNVLTVGNAVTKSKPNVLASLPYDMFTSSNYVEPYLTNKPEISAPGRFIGTFIGTALSGRVIYSTGTSFSAPHITGILAQLVQKYKNTTNINNYITYFKARLFLGAEYNLINDNTHRVNDSLVFFDKQGSGFVNAMRSARQINGNDLYVQLNSINQNYYVSIFTPPVSYSIKAVLVFEKPENIQVNSVYGNNFNLYLQNPSGSIIYKSSTSTANNFEIFEFTIPAGTEVLLRIQRISYLPSPNYISISYYWMEVLL